jgi:CxxC motif-containing protein
MTVTKEDGGKITVEGNSCKRGEIYAHDEFTAPKRMVTTSVRVSGGNHALVSVKTSEPISKSDVWSVINKLKMIEVKSPIKVGDVIVDNIKNNQAKVVATRDVDIA